MAISVTGTSAAAATTKQTAADAGTNLDASTPRVHFVDGDNQHVCLRMASDGPGIAYGNTAKLPLIAFTLGGQQGVTVLRLTQQNVNDLLGGLVNFANNGVLS